MTDFTEAMVPSIGTMLTRVAADAEQLALLERIVTRWPDRFLHVVARDVLTEWSRDEGSAVAIEQTIRLQLAEVVARSWPGAILFGVTITWHDRAATGEHALPRPRVLAPSPSPQALYVRAAGTVIPAPPENP